jgi:hypothetical protein
MFITFSTGDPPGEPGPGPGPGPGGSGVDTSNIELFQYYCFKTCAILSDIILNYISKI